MASKTARLSENERYIVLWEAEESLEYFMGQIQASLPEVKFQAETFVANMVSPKVSFCVFLLLYFL